MFWIINYVQNNFAIFCVFNILGEKLNYKCFEKNVVIDFWNFESIARTSDGEPYIELIKRNNNYIKLKL